MKMVTFMKELLKKDFKVDMEYIILMMDNFMLAISKTLIEMELDYCLLIDLLWLKANQMMYSITIMVILLMAIVVAMVLSEHLIIATILVIS